MHGEGIYLDSDGITWSGIFVEGQYDSKIQKKLLAEKILKDKVKACEQKSLSFFTQFTETFASSDKKTFKDNLTPFFGNTETCVDFLNLEVFPKFEERPPDKWNEVIKAVHEAEKEVSALSQKDYSTLIPQENILVEQLRSKIGGQLVEVKANLGEKEVLLGLCELPSEQWVLVFF